MLNCKCCIRRPQNFPIGEITNYCNIPMVSSTINAVIQNSLSTITISQVFRNNESKPLECEYTFPIVEESVVICLKFYLPDGTVLTSTIEEEEKAAEIYQDAISDGNTAMLSKIADPHKMTILIGNLAPQDSIRSEFTITAPVGSDESNWKFSMPSGFLPISSDKSLEFQFSIEIIADCIITSYSSNYPLTWTGDGQNFIRGVLNDSHKFKPENMITVKYKTGNTNEPSCIVQRLGNKFAAMMAFVPFCLEEIKDDIEGTGEFIFVLDRSGSMQGARIELAKKATVLFLKSLPEGSLFNIISFGTSFTPMYDKSQINSDVVITKTIQKIEYFLANMNGTNILTPLESIFSRPPFEKYPRTIFLLTDGQVNNAEAVVNLIKKNAGLCRVHGFGIGSGVDPYLIKNSAKAGRGYAYFIENNEEIGKKVINALKTCILPCMNSWGIDWPGECYPTVDKIGNVYYGERCIQYILLNDLPNSMPIVKCYDNFTKNIKEFQINGLQEVPGEQIFKLWAKQKIDFLTEKLDVNRDVIIQLSKEFGIPSEATAFICVKENTEAVSGDMVLRKVEIRSVTNRRRQEIDSRYRNMPKSLKSSSSSAASLCTDAIMKCSAPKSRNSGWTKISCRMDSGYEEKKCVMKKLKIEPTKSEVKLETGQLKKKKMELKVREKPQTKTNEYMRILEAQFAQGYWDALVLQLIPSINKVSNNTTSTIEAFYTLCVLCYLHKHYLEKYDEWELIEKKALKYLRGNNVAFADYKETISENLG